VLPNLTKAAIGFAKIMDKPSVDTLPVSMNGVAALSYHDTSSFRIQPLLVTEAGLVVNTMRRNPDLDIVNSKEEVKSAGRGGFIMAMPMGAGNAPKKKISPSANKNISKETFTTALALTRQINGKQQRIFISGDADFLSNSELNRYQPQVSNFTFSTALFSWLNYGEYPVDASRPDAKDNRVTVSLDHVSFLKIVYIYVIPGLILIFAAIFLIRRKRK